MFRVYITTFFSPRN